MEYKIVSEEGCLRTVEFGVSLEDYNKEFNAAIKQAQAYANLPGFRKGKVPANIIKQRFGDSLELEAIEKLANDIFKSYTTDENVKLAEQPSIIDINKDGDPITVKIRFEMFPNVELKNFKGLLIDEPYHQVNEEEIDHSILHIQIDNSTQEEAEEITDEFFAVEMEVFQKNEDGSVIDHPNPPIDRVFLHDHHVDPEIVTLLMNQKVGYEFDYTNKDQNKDFKLKIKAISKYILPELTPEFIKSQTEDRLESVSEFRDEINFSLQEKWHQNAEEAMRNQVIDKLLEMHDFPVPTSTVLNVAQSMFEDYKKRMKQYYGSMKLNFEEMKDKFMVDATQAVKWEFIRDAILEQEKIEVEDYDIENQFSQFLGGMDAAQIKKVVMDNPNLKMQLLSQKLFEYIIDFAEVRSVDFNGNPLETPSMDIEEDTPVAEEVK